MRFKKPYIAALDQVTIKREGEYAVIEYVEPNVSGVHLKIGPEVQEMTDEEILNVHNEILETQRKWPPATSTLPSKSLQENPSFDGSLKEGTGHHEAMC